MYVARLRESGMYIGFGTLLRYGLHSNTCLRYQLFLDPIQYLLGDVIPLHWLGCLNIQAAGIYCPPTHDSRDSKTPPPLLPVPERFGALSAGDALKVFGSSNAYELFYCTVQTKTTMNEYKAPRAST